MELIPISQYNFLYFYFLLLIVFLVFVNSKSVDLDSKSNINSSNAIGVFLVLFLLVYMGMRPINSVFGDMTVYNLILIAFQNGDKPAYIKDILFEYLMFQFSKVNNNNLFFFFISFLYIVPVYLGCKKIFKEYWFYGFFIFISTLTYWAYGTNGLRSGMASSIFFYGIVCDNKILRYIIVFMTCFIHQSMFLPAMAFVISSNYKSEKLFFYFWILAIPFSFVLGKSIENFFISLGIGNSEMVASYLGEADENEALEIIVGFRWDFILYSATAVYSAYYFIHKRKFRDNFYNYLVNIYLITNGFWILIIRANFSNRFVYLSWFMMGIIIVYPFLKFNFFNKQHEVLSKILVAFVFFSYLFNVVFFKGGVVTN